MLNNIHFKFFPLRDCTHDETCVLCASCFQEKDHVEHKVTFRISKGSGGSCDCGEDESWRNVLSCPKHQASSNNVDMLWLKKLEDSFGLKTFLSQLIAEIAKSLCSDIFSHSLDDDSHLKENPEASMVLFNDEKHSYNDVIQILVETDLFSEEEAHFFAQTIDTHVLPFLIDNFYLCY